MYMVCRVFVRGCARRHDTLFPKDTTGCRIAVRNPRFCLPDKEQPAAQLERRRVVCRTAILPVAAIPLTRRETRPNGLGVVPCRPPTTPRRSSHAPALPPPPRP